MMPNCLNSGNFAPMKGTESELLDWRMLENKFAEVPYVTFKQNDVADVI